MGLNIEFWGFIEVKWRSGEGEGLRYEFSSGCNLQALERASRRLEKKIFFLNSRINYRAEKLESDLQSERS
jgi:hypothetical protein